MIVTTEDVRGLLQSEDPAAVLVLVEGRTEVVSDRSLDSEPYRGALRIIDREELVKRLGGTDLSERELEEQAAALDTAVSEMGG